MRLARVATIASFELRSTVLRLGFLATTFGLPILLGAVTGTSAFVQADLIASQAAATASVGLVDEAGVLGEGDRDPEVIRFESRAQGLRALERRDVDTLFVLERDWRTTAEVAAITRADVSVLIRNDEAANVALARTLRRALADDVATPDIVARLVDPVALRRARQTPDGVVPESPSALLEALAAVMTPMLLGILLMSSLLMASGYLVQTIAQDKETKIVEVLLASATADELMAGKLVGLGAAGLVQFGIWALLGGGASRFVLAAVPHADLAWPSQAIAILPVFFFLGYGFLGSVMLATGAFGSSAAESQKLTLGWVLASVAPLLVLPTFLDAPHGVLARVFSFIPFTAPITIVIRVAVDPTNVSWLEVAAVGVELVIATAVAIVLGGRLFRVGLLMSGALPGVRAIWSRCGGRRAARYRRCTGD